MCQYSKLLCMSDETVQEIPVWFRTVFLPGVRSFGSEFGERTGTNSCSAGSEFVERTWSNPGSEFGLGARWRDWAEAWCGRFEFGEPAEFGTCQTRVIPGPFSELRTTQPGLTRSKSDFQTETPNSEQTHNPGPSWEIGLSRVYSDRQLNSDSHLVCFIVQLLE